ncbi:MAG TPA: hypothetical protein VF762_12310, partial [Blastocatellia bacterium]
MASAARRRISAAPDLLSSAICLMMISAICFCALQVTGRQATLKDSLGITQLFLAGPGRA